jgi:hypothetical protein
MHYMYSYYVRSTPHTTAWCINHGVLLLHYPDTWLPKRYVVNDRMGLYQYYYILSTVVTGYSQNSYSTFVVNYYTSTMDCNHSLYNYWTIMFLDSGVIEHHDLCTMLLYEGTTELIHIYIYIQIRHMLILCIVKYDVEYTKTCPV